MKDRKTRPLFIAFDMYQECYENVPTEDNEDFAYWAFDCKRRTFSELQLALEFLKLKKENALKSDPDADTSALNCAINVISWACTKHIVTEDTPSVIASFQNIFSYWDEHSLSDVDMVDDSVLDFIKKELRLSQRSILELEDMKHVLVAYYTQVAYFKTMNTQDRNPYANCFSVIIRSLSN